MTWHRGLIRPPGLRTRIIAGFAIGAFVLSAAMSILSYQLTEQFQLREREATAVSTSALDATVVKAALASDRDTDIAGILQSLDTGANRHPAVWSRGEWYLRTADNGITSAIPEELRRQVSGGQPRMQRVDTDNGPALIIGVPIDRDTFFFVVDSLHELDRSLKVLAAVLALVAVVTTAAGALLGRYAARYVLRPLSDVVAAARNISSGDVTIRLDPAAEPELAHLTTSFNEMVDQLSARMERDRRFAADVSHELRSPLQTLSAAASVLANRRGHLDDRTAMAADLVAEEIERFQSLVTDLLELARSDRPPQRTDVDIAVLAVEVCRQRNLPDDLVSCDGNPVWRVDRRRFEQTLGNLIDNAQHHGGGVVSIHVGREDDMRLIYIDDSGPGVSPDDRLKIFGRFVRGRTAHARGDSDGTGLGLSLVWQHVTAHGGTVRVIDRPGGGARFLIELPEQP